MTTRSEQLITDVHPALSTDPEATDVLGLLFSVAGTVAIDDTALTLAINDGSAPRVFPLASYTIAELVAALPTAVAPAVLQSDWSTISAQALTPTPARSAAAGEALNLAAYTAGIWRTMRPIAAGLEMLRQHLDDLIRQVDIRRASGAWLDLWGQVWNIPRTSGEIDSAYRDRLIYTITLPRVNNRGLEALILRALGRQATVADGSVGGMFQLNANGSAWWPSSGAGVFGPQAHGSFVVIVNDDDGADTSAVAALIQQYKAAGTTFTVSTSYAPIGAITAGNITGAWE